MEPSGLSIGTWASVSDDTKITATTTDDSVTLSFGGPTDSCDVSFYDSAIDRLIQVATEGRDLMRARRTGG